MVLSPRLQAIAHLVQPCRCAADIGTDHAYLPVWLCLENKCDTAIAADVNQGPLDRARETVERFDLAHRVSLRLGSGAEPLSPGEADTIVIAGMGGLLIGELLKASPEVFKQAKQILLQPMSSIPELREELYQLGYSIQKEILVREEEKLYHVLSVLQEPEPDSFSPVDFLLGKCLLDTRPEHFEDYLAAQKLRLTRKLTGLKNGKNPNKSILAETEVLLTKIEQLQKERKCCDAECE